MSDTEKIFHSLNFLDSENEWNSKSNDELIELLVKKEKPYERRSTNKTTKDCEYFPDLLRAMKNNENSDDLWSDKNNHHNYSIIAQDLQLSENKEKLAKEHVLKELKIYAKQHVYKNKFPLEYKKIMVDAYEKSKLTIKEIVSTTNLCRKNVERWIQNGIERKTGAGRKTINPKMEKSIITWVIQRIKKISLIIRRKTSEERYS